jgi:tetratricopeptide (TPR) repeat protein
MRFECVGEVKDVDESVETLGNAVSFTSDDHPEKSMYLNNLGISLITRFERLGEVKDLNKSIEMLEKAVVLTPEDHSNKAMYLSNLGISLRLQSERLGEIKSFDRSIEILKKAISLSPDGYSKSGHLSNLGNSLLKRFEYGKNMVDLDKAIEMLEKAISLTPNGYPNKLTHFGNLGNSLLKRFEYTRNVKDLDKSVEMLDLAVSLTPDTHPRKPHRLLKLGISLCTRYASFANNNDRDKAILSFKSSATAYSGSPYAQLESAKYWAELVEMELPQALSAYQVLIGLLPQTVWLGSSIKRCYGDIKTFIGDCVNAAVATAVAANQNEKAIEWSEQGQSIVWGQILSLRTPLDDLWDKYPILAADLERISQKLDQGGMDQEFARDEPGLSPSLEQEAQHHRRLAEQQEELIRCICSKPGFEKFLQPKKFDQLKKAAVDGPLVIVNLHRMRCDALILKPRQSSIYHVQLTDCSVKGISTLRVQLQSLLKQAGRNVRKTHLDQDAIDLH